MKIGINNSFCRLTDYELYAIDGGTFWGVVGGVATIVGGISSIVGGIALCGVPEPTTLTKFAGGACIGGGIAAIGAGIATIANNV